jgi:cysteine desulfuration protein SufE
MDPRDRELPAALDALARDFAFQPDWEGRYRLLLSMAKALPPLPLDLLTDETRVAGCSSQAWLLSTPLGAGRLAFTGDSDARLVRGLIAVLVVLLSGRRRGEIAGFDAEAAFAKLGLAQEMSAQRANGLAALVARIKREACEGSRSRENARPRKELLARPRAPLANAEPVLSPGPARL